MGYTPPQLWPRKHSIFSKPFPELRRCEKCGSRLVITKVKRTPALQLNDDNLIEATLSCPKLSIFEKIFGGPYFHTVEDYYSNDDGSHWEQQCYVWK